MRRRGNGEKGWCVAGFLSGQRGERGKWGIGSWEREEGGGGGPSARGDNGS
jgi:hypothetical protein